MNHHSTPNFHTSMALTALTMASMPLRVLGRLGRGVSSRSVAWTALRATKGPKGPGSGPVTAFKALLAAAGDSVGDGV